MDAVMSMLEGLTLWHWVGIGVVLLTLEVAVGTFDLLWIALAAFVTALFATLAPDAVAGWQGQLVCFGFVAVAFVVMGRTVFKGLRRQTSTHPTLNARTEAMVGERGHAITDFEDSQGRVKVGDTVWSAEQSDGAVIMEGDGVIVTGADGTTLRVRLH